MKAAVGHSFRADPRQACEEASTALTSGLSPVGPDWVLVFAAAGYFREDLNRIIKNITGAEKIVGCSTEGIITTDAEHEQREGLALLGVSSSRIDCRTIYRDNLQFKNLSIGRSLAGRLQADASSSPLACIFPDPYSFRSPVFFRGFREEFGSYPLLGGTGAGRPKSSDQARQATYQLGCGRQGYNSLSGFILSGEFNSAYGISPAHHPIGDTFFITDARHNKITELDGRPALDVMSESLRKYLSHISGSPPDDLFVALSINPKTSVIGRGEFILRNIIGVNTGEKLFSVDEQVREGQKISFAIKNSYGARDNFRTTVDEMASSGLEHQPAFGLLMRSSGRGVELYDKKNVDLDIIKERWGEFPLIGLQTASEIAPLKGNNYEHKFAAELVLVFPEN